MAIYSDSQTISSASYPAESAPSVVIPFEPKKVTFLLDDTGAGKELMVSLDGVSDHIHLHADHAITMYTTEQRVKRFWVKRGGVNTGLRVIAES